VISVTQKGKSRQGWSGRCKCKTPPPPTPLF